MADEVQLKILRQGVADWNAWRTRHRDQRIDLRAADLVGADLGEANLYEADLTGANLRDAALYKADLTGADLTEASLFEAVPMEAILARACLRRAKLGGAYLIGADLTGADFTRADLGGADLGEAKLRDADLTGANLRDAALYKADLTGADLTEASLFEAKLGGAYLIKADLTGADLTGADFTRADLGGADLGDAKLYDTVLAGLDLSSCKGLDSCRHLGPSTVDIRTLQRSGPLPLAFLRGVGLPDRLIEYLPSLFGQPIQLYSCFISYSSRNQDFADRLYADLQAKDVRCWFAPEDLKGGDLLNETIDGAIRKHDKLLLILSEASMTSAWVLKEARTALAEEKGRPGRPVLFPIRLDDAVMDTTEQWAHDIKRTRYISDFSRWKDHDAYQKAFNRLLRDLRIETTQPGRADR